ncbi:hypothetical protein [Halorubrum sp. DTA46]
MSGQSDGVSDQYPEQWEFDAIMDVAERWAITGTEAENYLIEVGFFDE